MQDWVVAVIVMLITMGFGWYLQRREFRLISKMIIELRSELAQRLDRILETQSSILENISRIQENLSKILEAQSKILENLSKSTQALAKLLESKKSG